MRVNAKDPISRSKQSAKGDFTSSSPKRFLSAEIFGPMSS